LGIYRETLNKAGAPSAVTAKKIDSVQYRRALNIYNRLVQARGDFRFPVPSFSLVAEERRVAGIDYDQLSIVLEEKALAVCNSFGTDADAAIAFLLAHELTHYYEKHAWRSGFADENRDLKIGIEMNKLADDAANETEADYLGGFLAYSAGYGVFQRGAEIIQSLYRAYGLKNEIPGYPSLSDRQALSRRTAERLVALVDVFEMANLLSVTGKYKLAFEYYRFLLQEYQSREIYNNLGVTATLDALELSATPKYRYPIQLDLESSAEKAGMPAPDAPELKEKFRQAILLFDAAISLDPNYAPAYLNKACVYALMGDLARARFYANTEARQASKTGNYPKVAQDIDVLMGIIEARSNNTKAAQTLFTNAEKAGSALAKINLRVLLKQPALKEIPPSPTLGIEKIDNLSLQEVVADLRYDPKKKVNIGSRLEFLQNPNIGAASHLFINLLNNAEKIVFHLTNPTNVGKTARGIGIGETRANIVKQYGEPARSLETPRGQIMVYPNILFIIGKEGKLERWANYQ
jgi:tetratricopeptide (TPR) repeat protein